MMPLSSVRNKLAPVILDLIAPSMSERMPPVTLPITLLIGAVLPVEVKAAVSPLTRPNWPKL
jgi:hypothetical protein